MFRHHPDAAVSAAHAEAEALLGRLGHDITTLDDGGDAANRQALADASERFNTAGAQLGQAQTTAEIAVARNVVIDGLHSTRLVRTKLGLDPGPDPAVVPSPAEQETHNATIARHIPGGLGGILGAGAAGGLLGMLGGGLLGEVLGGGGGFGGGGGWGDDGGGWGDDGGGGD